MSVTTVPIAPIKKGSITKYWLGVSAVVLAGAGLAWWGTADVRVSKATNAQYLADNKDEAGVYTTKTGLQILTLKKGDGPMPTDDDVAMVTIKGVLRDGTEFQPEASGPFPVSGGIPGFTEALKRMQSGGKYKIWIPAELGYGATPPTDPQTGQPVIPPDSLLIFDVEMVGFRSRAEVEAMQKKMEEQQKKAGAEGGGQAGGQGGGLPPDIQRQLEEATRGQ
jgi:FKBP-type peptidyl-prolyl cis-trans isomerase FkpA